jgi:hypothetical protein
MLAMAEPDFRGYFLLATQRSRVLKIGRLRIVWIFLVLLAAFVIFVQCIADVGGAAIPHPTPTPAATARTG